MPLGDSWFFWFCHYEINGNGGFDPSLQKSKVTTVCLDFCKAVVIVIFLENPLIGGPVVKNGPSHNYLKVMGTSSKISFLSLTFQNLKIFFQSYKTKKSNMKESLDCHYVYLRFDIDFAFWVKIRIYHSGNLKKKTANVKILFHLIWMFAVRSKEKWLSCSRLSVVLSSSLWRNCFKSFQTDNISIYKYIRQRHTDELACECTAAGDMLTGQVVWMQVDQH